MTPAARPPIQHTRDALDRLEHDVDALVTTANGERGPPSLVPLSVRGDGITLPIATPAPSPTGRNLLATGKFRIGIGPTRDLVLIEGTVRAPAPTQIPDRVGDAFAARTGVDPRRLTGSYRGVRIHPWRLQAWREANDPEGRELMRDGRWVVPD